MCMYLLPDVTNMCICNKNLCHASRFLTTEIQLLIPDVTHELNALSNIRYRNGSSSWHVLRNNRHIETECTPVYMVIRQRRGRDTPWWTYSRYNSHCSIFFFWKSIEFGTMQMTWKASVVLFIINVVYNCYKFQTWIQIEKKTNKWNNSLAIFPSWLLKTTDTYACCIMKIIYIERKTIKSHCCHYWIANKLQVIHANHRSVLTKTICSSLLQ